jgi:hypothetical protein
MLPDDDGTKSCVFCQFYESEIKGYHQEPVLEQKDEKTYLKHLKDLHNKCP